MKFVAQCKKNFYMATPPIGRVRRGQRAFTTGKSYVFNCVFANSYETKDDLGFWHTIGTDNVNKHFRIKELL